MAKKTAAKTTKKEPRTVPKRIFFYRANLGLDKDDEPIPFPAAKALAAVDELDFQTGERYFRVDDDVYLGCWVEKTHDRLRLANVRRSGLPQMDRIGKLSALNLPAGAGLVESIHVQFFKQNIVGAVFNFYGPRVSRLAYYLQQKVPQHCVSLRLNPILREDAAERLDDFKDIRMLDLRLLTPYQGALAKVDGLLGESVQKLIDAGNPQQVELILRPKPRSRTDSLKDRLLSSVRKMVKDTTLREGLTGLKISGYNGKSDFVEHLDMLSDEFVQSARIEVVENPTSKALRDASAYEAIQAAYDELRPKLEHAPSIE